MVDAKSSENELPQTPAEYGGDISDWYTAGAVLLIVVSALVLYMLMHSQWPDLSLLLAGILGTTMGWAVGIMITPYTLGERARFSDLSKVAVGLATGYVVGKLDKVLERLGEKTLANSDLNLGMLASHFVIWLIMFITVIVVTYITRSYDLSTRSNRLKAISLANKEET